MITQSVLMRKLATAIANDRGVADALAGYNKPLKLVVGREPSEAMQRLAGEPLIALYATPDAEYDVGNVPDPLRIPLSAMWQLDNAEVRDDEKAFQEYRATADCDALGHAIVAAVKAIATVGDWLAECKYELDASDYPNATGRAQMVFEVNRGLSLASTLEE